MNRFFDRNDWRRDLPRRVYARLDDLEPIVPGEEDEITFIFDAADADWEGFGPEGAFDLDAPGLERRISLYWRDRFRGVPSDGPDGYAEVPIYRVEISLPRAHPFFQAMPRDEEPWICLELTKGKTGTPVDVYGGLFAPPTTAFLASTPKPAPSSALTAIFDMTTWPDARRPALLRALKAECRAEALVCFDVGQGSASAITCECGIPIYYFDTGCGSGRNAPTAPADINFCTCDRPTVILSHWDTDHWAAAEGNAGLEQTTWVVPRQTISITHSAFASDILKAGGHILVVPYRAAPLIWTRDHQCYDLRRANGSGRNGTGLVLIVTDGRSGRSWVLTGDAGYNLIPHPSPADVAGMVVPHHGADMGAGSVPYMRSSSSYARLVYSFGPGNAHGPKKPPVQHPVSAAVTAHIGTGWNHGAWASPPAHCLAGGDVLATATQLATHLGGVAIGWNGAPAIKHLMGCPNGMPVSQI